jgi:hypothetical protein
MVQVIGEGKIDLSFMVSLECNLECPHCQYSARPNYPGDDLDITRLKDFMKGAIPAWDNFNSFGFYGGEPSLDLDKWGMYILLIDDIQKYEVYGTRRYKNNRKPMWMITNGTWSTSDTEFHRIVDFAFKHDLQVFISTTPYHQEHQDVRKLKVLVRNSKHFRFKKDDTKSRLLPMGRNYDDDWSCTRRCERIEETERLAIKPNGDVIYQKCDGIYPVVANISPNTVTWYSVKYMLAHQLDNNCPVLHPITQRDIGDPSWRNKLEARFNPEEALPLEERRFRSLSA